MDRKEMIERLHSKAQLTDKLIEQLKARIAEAEGYQVRRNEAMEINCSLKKQIEELKSLLIEKEKRLGASNKAEAVVDAKKADSRISCSKTTTTDSTNANKIPNTTQQNNGIVGKTVKTKEKSEQKTAPKKDVSKPVDISRLDLRIGRVMAIKKHPEADKLFVSEVDVGEDKLRTVCSGLVQHVRADEMAGRLVVVMCNLKPVKMRGISSEAMIMCASSPDKVEVLNPPSNSEAGDRISCPGYDGVPDAVLNPKHKVFETVQPDLKTNGDKIACYKDIPLEVSNKGQIHAASLKNTPIR